MRKDILEQFILDTIIEEMSKPNIMDIVVKNLMQTQEELYNNNQTLIKLQKAKKQFETQLSNILNTIELGVVNKTTNARMKELESQIEDMERQILIEHSKASVRISEEDIRKYYSSALKQESILLINYLIKEIKLYNDKAEITFNSPLKTSPNNMGLSFLSITRKIKNNTRTLEWSSCANKTKKGQYCSFFAFSLLYFIPSRVKHLSRHKVATSNLKTRTKKESKTKTY